MAQEVTLGGDRLGAGKNMTQELYNYGMNTFNQSRDWKSTAAPGLLYPCFKELGTAHGTFDIDIDTFVRTLPTKGPLFGSFKMQVDLFNVPFRLYQGILHNNAVDIGLNMHQVKLPKLYMVGNGTPDAARPVGSNKDNWQVSESALVKYLGLSGIGRSAGVNQSIVRKIQCVPMLGYYDIFKNYYSNKQEENAYIITPDNVSQVVPEITYSALNQEVINNSSEYNYIDISEFPTNPQAMLKLTIKGKDLNDKILIYITDGQHEEESSIEDLIIDGYARYEKNTNEEIIISINIYDFWGTDRQDAELQVLPNSEETPKYTADIKLSTFKLKNIDKMRAKLLACNELGEEFQIYDDTDDPGDPEPGYWKSRDGVDGTGLPYITMVKRTNEGIFWNAFTQNGLVTKTYQSDLFNNWLDTSFTDTIAQRTKIDTTSGGFTPDTLILQEKIYKLLNRILVSGGSYYDWQEATYGEGVAKMCEIPLYIGGMSTEIMFEEVISNAETNIQGDFQPLGSLGGKGMNTNKKGGNNIHVRMDEAGYIIGIMSITPRISVCQGNDWDLTELDSMDDIHKPELDGIGFQDLMAEQLAWWTTKIKADHTLIRQAVGKQTAWINYQTAVDKVYGDFAKPDGYSFMVLSRNYEEDPETGLIKDMTTYIDPAKYNYAFAVQDLAANNFWVQLVFKCESRRKMGAQQLPNL